MTLSNGDMHAFLVHGGVGIDLGALDGLTTAAFAVNSQDQVVGYGFDFSVTDDEQAFLYDTRLDPPLQNLNALIPAGSGIVVQQATGINDAGVIVGICATGGEKHACVLTPSSDQ
jgi:hypothetical protein